MTKFKILSATLCLGIFLSAFSLNAQKFSSLDKSPHDISYYRKENNSQALIKVLYGRPQLRGRTIGKEIASFGELWRTGANEATEVRFYQDVVIGNTLVKAGTYSLFTIPDKKEWTFVINKDIDVWGAYSYNEKMDVVRVAVPSESDKESLDALSIAFTEEGDIVKLVVGWGKVRAGLPISFNTENTITNEEPLDKDKSLDNGIEKTPKKTE